MGYPIDFFRIDYSLWINHYFLKQCIIRPLFFCVEIPMPRNVIQTEADKRKVRIYFAISMVTLVILLATLAIAGQERILRCERSNTGEVDCKVTQSILGVITLNSKSTAGVRAITIGEQCTGADCKFRLEMYAGQEVIPVDNNYTSNYSQLLDAFTKFNTFFTDTNNLNMQMNVKTNPILILGVAAVCVLIWVYLGYLTWQVKHPRPEE